MLLSTLDRLINWARQYSLFPLFFGTSCCFIEEAAAFTPRYDMARFGAEVLRGSPRQADLLIISGTVFKKIAPVILRLYEQMAEPKWVMSMGSCSNSGGMYDVYSVVQGVDQILPVDVYIPGCPPRPEAVLHGLTLLQKKIASERPSRSILHLGGGTQGSQKPILVDGQTKSRDTRGPGFEAIPARGTAVTPPRFWESRSEGMWTPSARRIELGEQDRSLSQILKERFGDGIQPSAGTSDMLTLQVQEDRLKDVLRFLRTEASPRFLRLEDLTAIDESARQTQPSASDYTLVYHLLSFDPATRLRLKVGLKGQDPATPSVTGIWPSANWYEREVYDMFGIRFEGHPNLRRLLLPHDWEGYPLRKTYEGRATLMAPYTHGDAQRHQPLDAGAYFEKEDDEHPFILNLGPHHIGTHGILRFVLSLNGEEITNIDMDVGYHHRGLKRSGNVNRGTSLFPIRTGSII